MHGTGRKGGGEAHTLALAAQQQVRRGRRPGKEGGLGPVALSTCGTAPQHMQGQRGGLGTLTMGATPGGTLRIKGIWDAGLH